MSPHQMINSPWLSWDAPDKSSLHTVMVFNVRVADASSSANDSSSSSGNSSSSAFFFFFFNYLVYNIPGDDVAAGDVVFDWLTPFR